MIRSVSLEAFEWPDDLTVVGRLFPFRESARVADPLPDGTLDVYDEEFMPGCTVAMRQAAAHRGGPRWIRFTFDHEQTFDYRAGFCRSLDERDDGVWGGFELYEGDHLDKYRSMLRTSHDGLSIEFDDITKHPPTGKHRQRRQIHIGAVTATPIPAYQSARVMAVREDTVLPIGTPGLDRVRDWLAANA